MVRAVRWVVSSFHTTGVDIEAPTPVTVRAARLRSDSEPAAAAAGDGVVDDVPPPRRHSDASDAVEDAKKSATSCAE